MLLTATILWSQTLIQMLNKNFIVAPGQLNPYLTQSITGTTPQWQPNLLTPSLLPGTLPSQNLYTQNFLQPQVAFAPQPQLQAINFIPPQPAVKSTVEVRVQF